MATAGVACPRVSPTAADLAGAAGRPRRCSIVAAAPSGGAADPKPRVIVGDYSAVRAASDEELT